MVAATLPPLLKFHHVLASPTTLQDSLAAHNMPKALKMGPALTSAGLNTAEKALLANSVIPW